MDEFFTASREDLLNLILPTAKFVDRHCVPMPLPPKGKTTKDEIYYMAENTMPEFDMKMYQLLLELDKAELISIEDSDLLDDGVNHRIHISHNQPTVCAVGSLVHELTHKQLSIEFGHRGISEFSTRVVDGVFEHHLKSQGIDAGEEYKRLVRQSLSLNGNVVRIDNLLQSDGNFQEVVDDLWFCMMAHWIGGVVSTPIVPRVIDKKIKLADTFVTTDRDLLKKIDEWGIKPKDILNSTKEFL